MRRYEKLVRDKIPEIIRASGERPVTRILDDDEYLRELIKKLDEEVAEFKAENNTEELADIQEVILALAEAIATRAELEQARLKKAQERGAFKGKVFLVNTKQ